jgi:hypothetical protein
VGEVEAVHGLIDMARSERAKSSVFSLDRPYYVGVEAAAEQVLHPDVDWVRNVHWLVRYNLAFISGYVETTALLAPLWGSGSGRPGAETTAPSPNAAARHERRLHVRQ